MAGREPLVRLAGVLCTCRAHPASFEKSLNAFPNLFVIVNDEYVRDN